MSYFLYLPYTVTYVVYDLLPVAFPGIGPYRTALELVLPLALVAAVLLPLGPLLVGFLAVASLQLALLLALVGFELAHLGAPLSSFGAHAPARELARGAGALSLLFVCGSLPLFLGGEVRGGARTVRLGLTSAFALVGAYFVVAAFPLAAAAPPVRGSAIPGYALAQAYGSRPLAIAVALGSAVSVAGLIAAEYVALGRLLHAALGASLRRSMRWIAVPFLAADALSLIDPDRFYHELLRPSLVALYLAQLPVFLVYPRFRARGGRLVASDLAAAALASALMGWGLYTAV